MIGIAIWLVIESHCICLLVLGRDGGSRHSPDGSAWNSTYLICEYTTHLNVTMWLCYMCNWCLEGLFAYWKWLRWGCTWPPSPLVILFMVNDCSLKYCTGYMKYWIPLMETDLVSFGWMSNGFTVSLSSTPFGSQLDRAGEGLVVKIVMPRGLYWGTL